MHARIPALVAALNSVDAAIRLFSPDLPLEEITPRRARPRHAARPGQISRVITSALREAGQPLTTHDLTLRVMEARQLNAADRNLFLTMQKRVLASLRNLRMGETVRSRPQGWEQPPVAAAERLSSRHPGYVADSRFGIDPVRWTP